MVFGLGCHHQCSSFSTVLHTPSHLQRVTNIYNKRVSNITDLDQVFLLYKNKGLDIRISTSVGAISLHPSPGKFRRILKKVCESLFHPSPPWQSSVNRTLARSISDIVRWKIKNSYGKSGTCRNSPYFLCEARSAACFPAYFAR